MNELHLRAGQLVAGNAMIRARPALPAAGDAPARLALGGVVADGVDRALKGGDVDAVHPAGDGRLGVQRLHEAGRDGAGILLERLGELHRSRDGEVAVGRLPGRLERW